MRLSVSTATSTSSRDARPMRAQLVADHLLPAPDRCLGGSPRVAGRFLPAHAAVLGDMPQMAVALRRRGLGRLALHRGRARRHDHGRVGMALGVTFSDKWRGSSNAMWRVVAARVYGRQSAGRPRIARPDR